MTTNSTRSWGGTGHIKLTTDSQFTLDTVADDEKKSGGGGLTCNLAQPEGSVCVYCGKVARRGCSVSQGPFLSSQESCYTINIAFYNFLLLTWPTKPVLFLCPVFNFFFTQTHHDSSVHAVGKVQVLEAGLCGEGVSVEPLQQREIQACASVAVLSCVDVGVHESRHQKLTGMYRSRQCQRVHKFSGAF